MANNFSKELREAVTRMIAKHGDAYNAEVDSWGDSRGQRNYEAQKHMKTCVGASMTQYEETFHWSISDSYTHDDHIGIRAFITCQCGEVENVSFIVEDANLSTILNWILAEEM
jgi:hypothetical protein